MAKYLKYPELNIKEKIYIAGLFDGEGAVMLFKHKNLMRGRKTHSYILVALITMTYFPIVNWLYKIIGGNFSIQVPKNKNHRTSFRWSLEGSRCVNFLKQIYPYLKLKNKQARIAFKFGKTINRIRGYKHKTNIRDLLYRDELCKLMKKLNKRGINYEK